MKALLVGMGSALAVAIIWVVGSLFLPVAAEMAFSWVRNDGGGIAGGSVDGLSTLLAAMVGFVVGVLSVTLRREA